MAPEIPPKRLSTLRRSELRASAPADFEEFWQQSLDHLATIEPLPQLVRAELADSAPAYLIEFTSKDGAQIRAWVSRKPDLSIAPRPLLVTAHGYGGASEAERVRRLGAFGIDVISVDIRGFGLSRDAAPTLSSYGWIMTGALVLEENILQAAVCDFLQAYRAGLDWFGPATKVMFQGFSFAGGLSLMACGAMMMQAEMSGGLPMAPPDWLAVGAPTFGNWPERLALCQDGSGREVQEYCRQHPLKRAQLLRNFEYFDACFFAPFVGAEYMVQGESRAVQVIAGVGAADPIVPAETVYSVYNALPGEPEFFEFPCSHTDWPEEAQWVSWESRWIRALRPEGLRAAKSVNEE